ncbi:MAG TPA: tyrosine-protein phosphatase [Streptosporangiaceae bacterium]
MQVPIAVRGLYNFRDAGGHRAADGLVVARGRLYRSDTPSKLRGESREQFRQLGVRTVIDLRHECEVDMFGRVPGDDGLSYHNISVEHRPYDQAGLSASVEPARYLADRYAELTTDGTAEIRQVLELIAAPGAAPVMIHCAAGKDRTGVLTALVLALLGVADGDIVADYARTGQATAALIAEWHRQNPGRALSWPAFGTAPAGAMALFLAGLAAAHGSVRGYAASQLGAGDDLVEALRRQFLRAR